MALTLSSEVPEKPPWRNWMLYGEWTTIAFNLLAERLGLEEAWWVFIDYEQGRWTREDEVRAAFADAKEELARREAARNEWWHR